MECNFCKNKLKSVSSLNFHKKKNKKCLEIQKSISNDIKSSLVTCSFCNKQFANINRHIEVCKTKKNNDNDNKDLVIESLQTDNNKLQTDNNKLQSDNNKLVSDVEKLISKNEILKFELNELKEYSIKLEAENNIYKSDHDTITSLAKQPKNVNTYNLSVYDDKIITDRFKLAINNATPADLYDGQKAIGRIMAPCLQNDDGTTMISCTDASRNVFVFKDVDGNLNKDIKCKNLANLIEPIATAKVDELINDDNRKRFKKKRIETLENQIKQRKHDIKKLQEHIIGFSKDSREWRNVNTRISKNEEYNEKDKVELEKLRNDEMEPRNDIHQLFIADCDEKLVIASDDIKEMKKDSVKFSKTISELV